jgi:hypothetical protein
VFPTQAQKAGLEWGTRQGQTQAQKDLKADPENKALS